MERYLLDTNFCIHFIRGRAWARHALGRCRVRDVAVSAVTVGELYMGIHCANEPSRESWKVEALLGPLEIVPFGRAEAIRWGHIEAQLRMQGNPIETEDTQIAATAQVGGFTLVSSNVKHFERVKGLAFANKETHPPEAPPQAEPK